MKNMKSFIEYTKYSKLVTEAVLDTARAGQARTNVKFDPARPFEQQRDQMLAGRWAGVSPRLIIGLMRFSRKWKSELDMCQIDRLPVSEEKFKIAAQLNGQSGMTVKDISEGGLKFKLEMQFPGKA